MGPPVNHLLAATASAVWRRLRGGVDGSPRAEGSSARTARRRQPRAVSSTDTTNTARRIMPPWCRTVAADTGIGVNFVSVPDWSGEDYGRVSAPTQRRHRDAGRPRSRRHRVGARHRLRRRLSHPADRRAGAGRFRRRRGRLTAHGHQRARRRRRLRQQGAGRPRIPAGGCAPTALPALFRRGGLVQRPALGPTARRRTGPDRRGAAARRPGGAADGAPARARAWSPPRWTSPAATGGPRTSAISVRRSGTSSPPSSPRPRIAPGCRSTS